VFKGRYTCFEPAARGVAGTCVFETFMFSQSLLGIGRCLENRRNDRTCRRIRLLPHMNSLGQKFHSCTPHVRPARGLTTILRSLFGGPCRVGTLPGGRYPRYMGIPAPRQGSRACPCHAKKDDHTSILPYAPCYIRGVFTRLNIPRILEKGNCFTHLCNHILIKSYL